MNQNTVDFNGSTYGSEAEKLAEEAARWFVRMREPQVSDCELQHFQHWLAASERHQQEYASFEKLWGTLDGLSRPKPAKKRMAASFSVIVATLAFAFVYSNATVDVEKSTKIGEMQHLVLADGSTIDIDADTVLRVEYSLWRRRITLEHGQALFNVAPGLRPFEVKAGTGTLRDIGTTFNVLEDQGWVTVSVEEGAVEISLDVRPEKYLLTGGQQATYGAGEVSASQAINPQAVHAWLENRWIFEGASLSEVARQINRQHERPIHLADASLDHYRVSGVFDRTDRAGLLKSLAVILPIKIDDTPEATRLRRR